MLPSATTTPEDSPLAASRCRTVLVEGVGELQVPRHITRTRASKASWGWQVRFSKPSKYFPDPRNLPPDQAAKASLEAAKAYLVSIWEPTPHVRVRTGAGYGGNPIAGVRLHTVKPRPDSKHYSVVSAFHPAKRGVAKQFWIGSEAKYTEARRKEAEKKAIEQRRKWLAEIGLNMDGAAGRAGQARSKKT